MQRCLALIFAACLVFSPFPRAAAQEPKLSRPSEAPRQSQPVLVAGTEFIIIEVPTPKGEIEKSRKKVPIVVVVFFWILAMFLWQLYFNRKQR